MAYVLKVPLSKMVNPYQDHQRVYAATNGGRPVWRRYADHAIVVSPQVAESAPAGVVHKAYEPSPRSGQRVQFSLLADISVSRGADGHTKRIDPIVAARQARGPSASWRELAFELGPPWLQAKGQRNGFRLVSLSDLSYDTLEVIRKGNRLRFGIIDYRGQLEVTDPELFRTAMLAGIGHAKSWGCGLLLCQRID